MAEEDPHDGDGNAAGEENDAEMEEAPVDDPPEEKDVAEETHEEEAEATEGVDKSPKEDLGDAEEAEAAQDEPMDQAEDVAKDDGPREDAPVEEDMDAQDEPEHAQERHEDAEDVDDRAEREPVPPHEENGEEAVEYGDDEEEHHDDDHQGDATSGRHEDEGVDSPRASRASREEPPEEEPEEPVEPVPMDEEQVSQKDKEEDKPYVECEEDAVEDEREKVEAGSFQASRTYSTLNVLPSTDSRLLIPLTDEGLGHLFAGVRATAGLKGGRYLFEVKILEVRRGADYGRKHKNIPRQLVAIGFSTSESSLFLGDGDESVGFDSEGCLILNGRKNWMEGLNDRIVLERQMVLAVVLNLIPDSPNRHTFSLFVNGKRVGRPQLLPEKLRDTTLYPTINFKNVTLHANFTAPPMAPLQNFKCRTLHEAAQEDVEVLPEPGGNQPDGKHEVIFLVGFPNHGTQAFLEEFQKEKQATARFTELSVASLRNWAKLSGFWTRGNEGLGIAELDHGNMTQNVVQSIAPFVQQNFIIKELPKNLLPEFRQSSLNVFDASRFKRTAVVMLGTPQLENLRALAREKLLKQRRDKVAAEVRRAKKPTKWDNGDKNALSPEELEAEIQKAMDAVEVTEEDEKAWIQKIDESHENELIKSFEKFTIPSEEEGFQEVCFVWEGEEESNEYLKQWIAEKKLVQKVNDLRPSGWFKDKHREWQSILSRWKRRQDDWKDPAKRRRMDKPLPDGTLPESCEEVDPWTLLDPTDIGTGEPLFSKFAWEDWQMLELRVQLHLLVHGYKHAMNDPQRVTFHERHTESYYDTFYRKPLAIRQFGVNSLQELLNMIKDTMEILSSKSMLDPQLSDDTPFENFLRLTEDARRLRLSRLDSGDATAVLRLSRPATPSAPKYRKEFRGEDDGRTHRHDRDRHGQERDRYGGNAGGDRHGDRGKGNRYGKGDRKGDRGKGPPRDRDDRGAAPRQSGGYDRSRSDRPRDRRDAPPRERAYGEPDRGYGRRSGPGSGPPPNRQPPMPPPKTRMTHPGGPGKGPPRDRDDRGGAQRQSGYDRGRSDRPRDGGDARPRERAYGEPDRGYGRRSGPGSGPPPGRQPPKTRYDSGGYGGYKGGQRGPPR